MKTPSFGLILVAAFAIGTGLNGLYTGASDLPDAPNTLATIVAIFNLTMGIGGIAGAVMVWRQHPAAMLPLAVWGASAVGASLLAPRAYAPETGWIPAIVGSVVTAALIVTILLYVRWRLTLMAPGESTPAS